MKPIWTYTVENAQIWKRGLKVWAFRVVRDDGKVICEKSTLGEAQAVRIKFAAWALQPWGRY